MRLSTLKKLTQHSTRARGHRMTWGQVYGRAGGPQSVNGQCRDCGAYAWVQERPAPNSTGVSGLAVAVTCREARRS